MKLSASVQKLILNTATGEDFRCGMIKLLIECWNHDTPHFGGCGPHRYDGNEKLCAYCNRPKNWKKVNAGYYAGELLYSEDSILKTSQALTSR